MKPVRWTPAFQVFLLVLFSSAQAIADGGVMRLSQAQGPFLITIFSTPELVPHRPVDVSLLIQRRDSKDVVLDAAVDLLLTPPPSTVLDLLDPICGRSTVGSSQSGDQSARHSIRATRGQSSNKLLYAAAIEFGAPGDWTLDATVTSGGDSVQFSCRIPVGPPPRLLAAIFPFLVLPPFAVVLFAVNQRLRKSRGLGKDSDCTAGTGEASTPCRTGDTIIQT